MKKLFISLSLFLLAHYAFAQEASKQLDRNRNYADLLQKSILFFEAQACGPNVSSYSSFDWRGSCHTGDALNGLDLSGGWHDAGDHVKFNYPMGQAVYNLATLYVDHREQINATGNKTRLLKQLRFISDYMMRCHPEPNKYVIQIAEGIEDHKYWQVPEEQGPGRVNNYPRPIYMADENNPNTNLACINAAAFAAMSMALKGTGVNGDEALSAELLQHARDLYNFGYQFQRSYNYAPLPGDAFADGYEEKGEFNFYKDFNGYQDEIMVGAAWLYRATGEQRYRNEASTAFANLGNTVGTYTHGWGNNEFEATLQMARATSESKYLNALGNYVRGVADGNIGRKSQYGLWSPGGSGFNLPLALGAALVAYRFAELVGSGNADYNKARGFAFQQVNYALGNNKQGRSYVVGFGTTPPRVTHHRAAHSPENGGPGPIDTNPNLDSHILTGALVMGPRVDDDSYSNTRTDVPSTEPALGNNGILAAVAVLMVKETGATAPPPTTTGNVAVRAKGTTGSEQIEIQYKNNRVGERITLSTSFQEYKVQVNNANGNFKVAFVNDNGTRDTEIDWLQVGATKRQAETRSTNTAVWQNGSCGGSNSQIMNCNGYIDFGTMSSVTSGQLVIRARGTCGSETMVLQVAGQDVKTWTNLSASFTNYTYDNYSGSKNVKVRFTNDGITSSGCDKNLIVDKVTVCGTVYQAESATRNGCGSEEWLYCNGNFDFGTVGCSSARLASSNTKSPSEEVLPIANEWFSAYPNPAAEQLTVGGGEDYQLTLYDMNGRLMMQHDHLNGKAALDIRHLRSGLYLIKLRDSEQHELRQRIIIE